MNNNPATIMSRRVRIRQLALSLALALLIVGLAKTASAQSFVIAEPPTPCPAPCPATSTPLGVPITTGDVVLLQPLPGTSSSACTAAQATTDPSCWSDIVRFSNATGTGFATIFSDCNDADCPFPPPPPGVFIDEFTGLKILTGPPLPSVFLVEDCSPSGNGKTMYNASAGQPGGPLPGVTGSNSYVIVSDCEAPSGTVPEPSSFALIALSLVSFVPFALLRRKRLQATAN